VCRTVVLRFRFDDFTRGTRSHTLPMPTSETGAVLAALRLLLLACTGLIAERGLTLLGVTLTNLDTAESLQLELPLSRRDATSLDQTLDRVRDRYGTSSITRGVLLGSDPGLVVPVLPD
jgi:DNA polymerase-4